MERTKTPQSTKVKPVTSPASRVSAFPGCALPAARPMCSHVTVAAEMATIGVAATFSVKDDDLNVW
jgi:hypothetical protein